MKTHPEFHGIDPMRILKAFVAYVKDDVESGAMSDYLACTLTEKCGLSRKEITALGFGEIFEE